MNHIEREVRRARRIWAWIRVQDRTIAECQVMDISSGGAKIATTTSALVPDRFELAFAEGGQTRSCEVIWRHGRICGSNSLREMCSPGAGSGPRSRARFMPPVF
jgi:hypothetical protein